ncbi:unnamed protein product [Pleuronectes platessa]|uniref:Fibrillar collagen NC1 domain-containing protein n=1 Tax=Pleuronectes platessa TaxID=8262 RepID=A0A9N7VI29_PLEPL|nr:unnamed protein product [Pleuronectes platessa]
MRRPLGTFESPARTCKELIMVQPHYKDGEYWIDPNQGCHRDSIKVYCNFTADGETCLYPDKRTEMVKLAAWNKETPGSWYSQYRKGKQFSYNDRDGNPVHVVQLTFLKLLSATAKQSFTYTCQNSAGWFDSTSRSHQQALRFRGSNDEELTQAKSPFITAVHDGCQSRKGQERTVLEIDSPSAELLPIMDVAPVDFGRSNQKFGFQVGRSSGGKVGRRQRKRKDGRMDWATTRRRGKRKKPLGRCVLFGGGRKKAVLFNRDIMNLLQISPVTFFSPVTLILTELNAEEAWVVCELPTAKVISGVLWAEGDEEKERDEENEWARRGRTRAIVIHEALLQGSEAKSKRETDRVIQLWEYTGSDLSGKARETNRFHSPR